MRQHSQLTTHNSQLASLLACPFIIYSDDVAQTKKNRFFESRNCSTYIHLRKAAKFDTFLAKV